jgi:CRISPR-associated protein Cmr6
MQPIPSSTRQALRQRGSHQPNFGLWLERCVDTQGTQGHWKTTLDADKRERRPVDGRRRLQLDDPQLVRHHTARWQKMLEQVGVTEELQFTAAPEWRVIVGLGAESVLETSIRLHRIYGFPIIPGSALKGMTRAYVKLVLEPEGRATASDIRNVFGSEPGQTPHFTGQVVFYDAVPMAPPRLELDIMNPHYGPYYREVGKTDPKTPPADWHDPKPVYFLTVASGSPFYFAVGPRRRDNEADIAAAKKAKVWLLEALEVMGVGAKTTTGYGVMTEASVEEDDTLSYAIRRRQLLEESPPAGRMRGVVVKIQRGGDFGWINPARGGVQMFVHHSQLQGPVSRLRIGQVVEYEIGTYKGREQAQKVEVLLEAE